MFVLHKTLKLLCCFGPKIAKPKPPYQSSGRIINRSGVRITEHACRKALHTLTIPSYVKKFITLYDDSKYMEEWIPSVIACSEIYIKGKLQMFKHKPKLVYKLVETITQDWKQMVRSDLYNVHHCTILRRYNLQSKLFLIKLVEFKSFLGSDTR